MSHSTHSASKNIGEKAQRSLELGCSTQRHTKDAWNLWIHKFYYLLGNRGEDSAYFNAAVMVCTWKITHSYMKSMFLKGSLGFWDTIQPVRSTTSSHKCLIWKSPHSLNTVFFQAHCASRIQHCGVLKLELAGMWSLRNVMRSGVALQPLRITLFLLKAYALNKECVKYLPRLAWVHFWLNCWMEKEET